MNGTLNLAPARILPRLCPIVWVLPVNWRFADVNPPYGVYPNSYSPVGQQLIVAPHFALTHFFKNLTKLIWVTPAIKNTKDDSFAINHLVINCVRKTLCQQPVKSEMN
jgi:hypothetical protein